VRLFAVALDEVGVVQLERGPFRADAGQFGEVVPRSRAAGGPFEGVAETPRVVGGSVDAPSRNAPIEGIACRVVKPSVAR
jgi:hypothetical protein